MYFLRRQLAYLFRDLGDLIRYFNQSILSLAIGLIDFILYPWFHLAYTWGKHRRRHWTHHDHLTCAQGLIKPYIQEFIKIHRIYQNPEMLILTEAQLLELLSRHCQSLITPELSQAYWAQPVGIRWHENQIYSHRRRYLQERWQTIDYHLILYIFSDKLRFDLKNYQFTHWIKTKQLPLAD